MESQLRTQLIATLESEIERQLEIVVQQFQSRNNDVLLRTTETGGWSVIQNLEHLNFYFQYYNPAIRKSLENASVDPQAVTFNSSWLGSYFTNAMDYRKGGKVKAFKSYIPEVDLDTNKVIREFIDHQEELLQLLRMAANYNLTKIRLPISLTRWIKMRLGDVFQFVIMHNERHIVQAQSRL